MYQEAKGRSVAMKEISASGQTRLYNPGYSHIFTLTSIYEGQGVSMSRAMGLASIAASSFIMPYIGNAINVAAPAIAASMGVRGDYVALLQMALALATGALAIPMGRVGDLLGRARVYRVGVAVVAASSIAAFLSRDPTSLMASAVAMGAGAAMVFGTNYAIIASMYPPGERGKAIGLNTLAVYTGLSSGPFVGGVLTSINWRLIFLVNVVLAVLSLALSASINVGPVGERKYDAIGAALLASSLALSIWGMTYEWYVAAAGLLLLALFALHESKAPAPLLDLSVFRRARFTAAVAAAMLSYMATFAVTYALSFYLQELRGLPPSRAGALLLPQPVMMAVFAPLSGWLSDRVDPGVISSAGMGLVAAALFSMTFIGAATPLRTLELELALLGLGFALFISPNTNIIMSSVEPRHHGMASAIVAVARLAGQSTSMALMASVQAASSGVLAATRSAMALFSAISFAAAALSLVRIRYRGAVENTATRRATESQS